LLQCDEARPVCQKCAIHYSNIQKCDYGDESPTGSEPAVKKPAAEKIRRALNRAVPILPKSRQEPQFQGRIDQPLVIRESSTLSAWDPFTQHPPTVEPEINLLMATCR
jgi:hypothetical protein